MSEIAGKGRMPSYGKVALAAIADNEDGAHHVAAELLQALLEVGFSVPPGGVGSKTYIDLDKTPKPIADWTPMLASNAVHIARLLKEHHTRAKADRAF